MITLDTPPIHSPVYRDILESIYDGYYEVDECANLVMFNSSLCEILDVHEGALSQRRYMRYLSFSVARSLRRLFVYVLATGNAVRALEFPFVRSDGKVLTLEASATRICDTYGRPIGMRGIIRNVTDRKRTERAQRESHERFRSLFMQNADAVVQFNLDGMVVDVNPRTVEMMGYAREEMIGFSFGKFLSAADARKIRRAFTYARTGHSKEYEVVVRPRQGTPLQVLVKTVPITLDDEVVGVYAICDDITERREASVAVERLSMQNQLILNSAGDGICSIDSRGNAIMFNSAAERMTGYSASEIIGRNIHTVLHRHMMDELRECPIRLSMETGTVQEVRDDVFWRKDGTLIQVEYTVSPMREKARVTGAVITFRDVTTQRQAEDWLLRSEKLSVVGQLAAGIAHEIRNPLTALKGFLQLFANEPCELKQYVQIMHDEIDRIHSITNELLAFSRPNPARFHIVDVNDLVSSVSKLLSSQAILRGVECTQQFLQERNKIRCDADRIRQVLVNLVKNAIDAMEAGGALTICTWQSDGDACISITDTGIGMASDVVSRVGEPFFTTKSNGTGLGIMVCQRIIESHNGRMEWDSQVGRGTTVTIRLPCVSQESSNSF